MAIPSLSQSFTRHFQEQGIENLASLTVLHRENYMIYTAQHGSLYHAQTARADPEADYRGSFLLLSIEKFNQN